MSENENDAAAEGDAPESGPRREPSGEHRSAAQGVDRRYRDQGRSRVAGANASARDGGAASNIDMFDFASSAQVLLDAIRHHSVLICVVALAVVLIAFTYHMLWPPVYLAEAMITAERNEDAQRDAFYKEWNLFRKGDARTETELIKTGEVLRELVRREQLRYDDVYHPFFSQISHFWEISWPGRLYRATKRLLFGASELDQLTPEEKELGKTVRDLRAGISIITTGDILAAEVHAKGPSPRVARITNTLLDVYLEWRKEQSFAEARASMSTLDEQIAAKHTEISEIAARRVAFLGANNLVFDFNKEMKEIEHLVTIEAQIADTGTRIASLRASIMEIERQLSGEPPTKVLNETRELNAVREDAKHSYLEVEQQLINLQNRYRDDSPEILELRANMAKYEALINGMSDQIVASTSEGLNSVHENLLLQRSRMAAELEGLEAGLESMAAVAANMRERQRTLPALGEQLRDLDREAAVSQQVYNVLLTKREQAAASLASAATVAASLRVVDYAATPASQSWPKAKYLYPGALLVGLFVGLLAAILKNVLGGRVYQRHLDASKAECPLYAVLDVVHGNEPV